MNYVLILYYLVLIGAFGHFIVNAYLRVIKFKEDTLIQKCRTKYYLSVKDKFNIYKFRSFLYISDILFGLLFLIVLFITYFLLGGLKVELIGNRLEFFYLSLHVFFIIFFVRINLINAIIEDFIVRYDNLVHKHHEVGYVIINVAFIASLVYRTIIFIF